MGLINSRDQGGLTAVMRESSSISPNWSLEFMVWNKHFRGSLREIQIVCTAYCKHRSNTVVAFQVVVALCVDHQWLLHSWCCAATNVRGGGLLRLGGLLLCLRSVFCSPVFEELGVKRTLLPQVLLRPVSPPDLLSHKDEISCHHNAERDFTMLSKKWPVS